MEIVDFAEEHLDGVLRLTAAEGWPSLAADPARALRVLTAPGARSVVAVEDGAVVGFAWALTDGEITSYLSELVVAPELRGQRIGARLIEAIFARCGTARLDLLAEDGSEGFYERLLHRRLPGFRVYPGSE